MVDKRTKKSLVVAFVTVGLDLLFHILFTEPLETFAYFISKFILAFVIANFFLFNKRVTLFLKLKWSAIFTIIFGIYYRVIEVLDNKAYLSRVPDINIGSFTVTSATPIQSGLTWAAFHGGFFLVGIFAAENFVR